MVDARANAPDMLWGNGICLHDFALAVKFVIEVRHTDGQGVDANELDVVSRVAGHEHLDFGQAVAIAHVGDRTRGDCGRAPDRV